MPEFDPSGRFWPSLGRLRRFRPDSGRCRPNLVDVGNAFRPSSGRLRPTSADVGRVWADFVRARPNFDPNRPHPADLGQIRAQTRPIWALARPEEMLTPLFPGRSHIDPRLAPGPPLPDPPPTQHRGCARGTLWYVGSGGSWGRPWPALSLMNRRFARRAGLGFGRQVSFFRCRCWPLKAGLRGSRSIPGRPRVDPRSAPIDQSWWEGVGVSSLGHPATVDGGSRNVPEVVRKFAQKWVLSLCA